MRAMRCHAFGPLSNLSLEEVPAPLAGPGQVLLDVHACGINFFDGLMVAGKYQFKPAFPFAPGAEVAGVVRAVGPAAPAAGGGAERGAASAGTPALRPGMRVLAFLGHGGLAEQVAVDAWRVAPVPDSMDFGTAAALPITYLTSIHALADRAQLRAGETLLVLGAAGGVGLAAVELGKLMGARVIAAASSARKLALCREHGADETIDYATEDLRERLKALTRGRGVDVVYDPVGDRYTEPCVRSLAPGGRLLVVGFAAGEIPRLPLNLLLLKSAAAVGVFWGAFAESQRAANAAHLARLLAWCAEGRLRPHLHGMFPFERAREAIELVMNRGALGKVVVSVVTGEAAPE
jgi:NADPH2:quinone reductase